MDRRTTGIIAYITWVGLIIAFVAGDNQGARFHLNQALVIWLFGLLSVVPFVGWIWSVFIFICAIIGIIHAANDEEIPVPLIGGIQILK